MIFRVGRISTTHDYSIYSISCNKYVLFFPETPSKVCSDSLPRRYYFRWRGSALQCIWLDLALFSALYALIAISYNYFMFEPWKRWVNGYNFVGHSLLQHDIFKFLFYLVVRLRGSVWAVNKMRTQFQYSSCWVSV